MGESPTSSESQQDKLDVQTACQNGGTARRSSTIEIVASPQYQVKFHIFLIRTCCVFVSCIYLQRHNNTPAFERLKHLLSLRTACPLNLFSMSTPSLPINLPKIPPPTSMQTLQRLSSHRSHGLGDSQCRRDIVQLVSACAVCTCCALTWPRDAL